MRIKSIEEIREKWARVTATRGPDYQKGIENPKADWKTATVAAEANYDAGIQRSVAEKRFGKGVVRAGSDKWKRGAIEKGVARWPVGIAVAGPDFEAGFKPFREALSAVTLPPRRARRDPANLQRVAKVVEVMIETAKKRK